MRRWSGWWVVAALAVACGRGGSEEAPAQAEPGADAGARPGPDAEARPGPDAAAGPGACGGELTVRILGVEPSPAHRLALQVAALELVGPAGPIAARAAPAALDLPAPGAYRLATAPVPATPGPIDATLRVTAAHVTDGASAAALATCGAPLVFRFDPARIDPGRCHVVLHLDLARTVQQGPDGLAFLPRYAVHY